MQDGTDIKVSHKGVPKKGMKLDDSRFLRCLYEDEPGKVSYKNIQISKRDCLAKTCTVTKRPLNGLYMKFHVKENRISIRPHSLNGLYI